MKLPRWPTFSLRNSYICPPGFFSSIGESESILNRRASKVHGEELKRNQLI